MLILAGLGISDEKGITLEELEEAKTSDFIFVEFYTSIWHGNIKNLEMIIGKKIEILKRSDLEENSEKILELASNKKVMIFVPGDPLAATTHSSLIIECKKRGIKLKIIHNSSIFSAIYETGLHSYKFGPTVTIPLKERIKDKVESIIEVIKENKIRGLHTLCLLDIDLEKNIFLEVSDAIKFLIDNKAIENTEKVLVASCIGSSNSSFIFDNAINILNRKIKLPAVIIILGKLHFSERDMLEKLQTTF
jgi:diphthine synthase